MLIQNYLLEGLQTLRRGQSLQSLAQTLGKLEPTTWAMEGQDSDHRLALWLNAYHFFFYHLRQTGPKKGIYTRKFPLSQSLWTLDLIEHGLLRRGRWKYGLGYLPAYFFEPRLALGPAIFDPRIHFALNCGAKSCPPLAFYRPETLALDLAEAEAEFLPQSCWVSGGRLYLSRLFLWFWADFSGRSGIQKRLGPYFRPDDLALPWRFAPYDWTEVLDVWRD